MSILQHREVEAPKDLIEACEKFLQGKISKKDLNQVANSNEALRKVEKELRSQGKDLQYWEMSKPSEGKYVLSLVYI